MAHAFNPNYPNKYDPNHQTLLGKGPVLKYSAGQKYASTAASAAPIIQLCKEFGLPYQSYVSRSDIPSGSTVGPVVAETLGIPTVDLGCAQLAMHAARELMSSSDFLQLCHLLTLALSER
jgi:aspartyl aminopeptidase